MKQSPPLWKQVLRFNFTDWRKLFSFLEITEHPFILEKTPFPLNLPLRLAQKISKGQLDDPILLQFLPMTHENHISPLFSLDPVADTVFRKTPKLLHKYQSRALLMPSSACAMHCRYCFRRHFPYETEQKGWDAELQEIAKDTTLSEIILSGGDPLSLSNESLKQLFLQLHVLAHVKKIRFHTRFPVGIPERIDEEFLQILKDSPQQIIFIIHINHPRELDDDIISKCKEIQKLGIPLLCQSVLLKGVNDQVEVLEELYRALIDVGILPYYLHQLDRVQGALHFEVEEERGKMLIEELNRRLPGYAVPKYVKEEPHRAHKTIL